MSVFKWDDGWAIIVMGRRNAVAQWCLDAHITNTSYLLFYTCGRKWATNILSWKLWKSHRRFDLHVVAAVSRERIQKHSKFQPFYKEKLKWIEMHEQV